MPEKKERFENLTLEKEYPKFISDKYNLRIYTTKESDGKEYRWHLGFPKKLVKPVLQIIETTPYWGNEHWAERDGFYIYYTATTTDDKKIPKSELEHTLKFHKTSFNKCINWLRKKYI